MGYTTKFTGALLFTSDITAKELAKIKSFFGEDCRDHPEWDCDGTYIDLELNDDFTGIRWDDGTEKNSGMVDHINLIIREMQKDNPAFGLAGGMNCQGEDASDRWQIGIHNNVAVRIEWPVTGKKVACPSCGKHFIVED